MILVQITSDPEVSDAFDNAVDDEMKQLHESCAEEDANKKAKLGDQRGSETDGTRMRKESDFGDIDATYRAAMAVRSRTGDIFAQRIRKWIKDEQGEYFHLGLRNVNVPLGWSLSSQAQTSMDNLLTDDCHVRKQMEILTHHKMFGQDNAIRVVP